MRQVKRSGFVLVSAAALLAAACTDDPPLRSTPVSSDDTGRDTVQSSDPEERPEGPTTTESSAPPPFAGLDHSSVVPVIELCSALATRSGDTVVALIAEDAIATDHTTGVIHRGRTEIREWLDDDPGFALFERTDCAPAGAAIASHFWSATTYAFSSDTNPGGTEGILVAGTVDGLIDRLDVVYRSSPDETDAAEPVAAADEAVLNAFCEAWGSFDVDGVLELTTDDIVVVPNTLAVEEFFRPRPGPGAIRGAMDFLTGGTVDRGECPADTITNGGWLAETSRFVDDTSDTTFGGISVSQLRNGRVSIHMTFMDLMADGTLVFGGPPQQTTAGSDPDPALTQTVARLETVGWWEFASGYLGADLSAPEARNEVAADVVEICALLDAGPASFDDVLDEMNQLGERRETTIGASAPAYALVLDTAISAACPNQATIVGQLRPQPDPPTEAELMALDVFDAGDPRPGDLRTDPVADLLPVDYEPPPATWTVHLAYGTEDEQGLDVYLPHRTGAPVILFLHGGGWTTGTRGEVPRMVLRFVERGYAVVSAGYRLAPEHTFPAQIHDVKHAIRWLKAFGAREGLIDGDRIVVYGFSAGGHLAAFAAATPGLFEPTDLTAEVATFDSSVAGVVSVAGPTDLVSFYGRSYRADLAEAFLGCGPCGDEALAEASPITYLGPDLPPAYWAYGAEDFLVDPTTQGAVIASAWAEQTGADSSWFDLVDSRHNIDHTAINQRSVEAFVDFAIAQR